MKNLIKSGFTAVTRVGQTAKVAAETGWKIRTQQAPAPVLLREAFERLGATYIKLGQFIASSPSLFPPEYVREFQSCLDRTPPTPFRDIVEVIESSLGSPWQIHFKSIEPIPLASASIAQVHAARLHDGSDVVIKVQKPGVGTLLHTDLNMVQLAAQVMEKTIPGMSYSSLANIVKEIRVRMVREVDFIEEADNIADFIIFLKQTHNEAVTAPYVYREHSAQAVLTMERLYGVPLTDLDALRQYADEPSQVLITAMNTWFASLMGCPSFHADLHAGNLLLLRDGRVAFIDFGIVGKLDPTAWRAGMGFMEAFSRQDYRGMAANMSQMGMAHQHVDENQLATDLERVIESLMNTDPQAILSGHNMGEMNLLMADLVQVGQRHGLKFPEDFTLLIKQMMYFDRFIRILAPQMDMFQDSRLHPLGDPQNPVQVERIQHQTRRI